jgi:hypothetical protein
MACGIIITTAAFVPLDQRFLCHVLSWACLVQLIAFDLNTKGQNRSCEKSVLLGAHLGIITARSCPS